MQIEITGSYIDSNKVVHIDGHSTEELHLIELERGREDRIRTLHFQFDTKEVEEQKYITKWLHRQKITKGSKTYGEAVRSVLRTITLISGKYIVADA